MSSRRSRSSDGHIERSTDDVGGIAKPASRPNSTSTAVGASSSVLATSSPSAAACTNASGGSTRRWPNVSTSRPCTGAPTPLPAASEPATTPAIANEPVRSRR